VTATVAAGTNPFAAAVNPATNKIYVTNKGDNTVTVIDGLTNATSTVTVGMAPTEIAVNPVTNKIYVTDFGGGSVTVIDGATNTVTATVTVGSTPEAIAVNPVTNQIYVANTGSANVTVINGATNTVTATVAAGIDPEAVAVNPVTNTVYVANLGSANVTVINGATNTATATVNTGNEPSAVAVNPVTNQVYVANTDDNNVTVIDGATNTAAATVNTGVQPVAVAVNPVTNQIYVTNHNTANVTVIDGASNTATATVAAGTSPLAVAVNPLTNQVYVTNLSSSNVTVIDGATNATTTVTVGSGPRAVAVNPVTDKIYAANNGSANVTVIDGATNNPTTVAVGSSPQAVALNPVTNTIYVANYGSNNVTVINGTTNAVLATVAVGGYPEAIAVNPATNMVYVANLGDGTVTAINGATNTKSATVTVGPLPVAVAVNPVTNQIYVANDEGTTTVTVIDGATNNPTTVPTPLATNARAVAVNSATNMIYVANGGTGNVTVINGATNTVAATVAVGALPVAIAVNPVTNMVYVANEYSASVTVINGATNTVAAASVPTDANPFAVAVNPVTNTIYVANYEGDAGAGDATVINGATNTVIATVATGGNPYAIAVNPMTNKIYEANNGGNNVTVIDGATNTVITNVAAESFPYAVAVNPVTGKIYVPNQASNTVTVITEQQVQTVPLSVSITPLTGNQTATSTPNFTFIATSAFIPTPPPPPLNVFFQADTWQGPWTPATFESSLSGVLLCTATTAPLQQGFHILYAYADDGQDATSVQLDSPLISNIAAYPFLVTPATATQFSVSAPAEVTQGIPFSVTVTATDSLGDTVSTYAGTVQFTSSDPAAVLPAPTTLTNGTGTFLVTLNTLGPETITATDTVTPSITGTTAAITVGTGAATHFTVSAPATATAGSPVSVTVTAFDAAGNKATGYTGFVSISSSDLAAGLPSPGMLTNGMGAFSVTFNTAGSQTVTATDTVTSSITGVSSSIIVYPAPPPTPTPTPTPTPSPTPTSYPSLSPTPTTSPTPSPTPTLTSTPTPTPTSAPTPTPSPTLSPTPTPSPTPTLSPTAPPAPTNLYSRAKNGQVTLLWSPSTGATGYNVYRSATSGGPYTLIGSTAGGTTTYTDHYWPPDGTFYYVVTAVNSNGESGDSNQVSGPPLAPANLTAAPGNRQVALSWSPSAGATGYNVYRSTTSGGPYTLIEVFGGTTYTDGALLSKIAYYWVVTAISNNGESVDSNEASATLFPPPAPTNLAATPGNYQVALSWSPSTGAEGYNLYRSTTSGGPYTLIETSGGTTYTDGNGLVDGTTYYYVVTAANGNGESADSGEVGTVLSATSLVFSPIITAEPNPQIALVGGTASFTVSAIGNPAPSYQWLKNGVPIAGATSATLILSNIQNSDAAGYDVMVSNPPGTVASSFAVLTITATPSMPSITGQPANTTAVIGDTVSLTVAAEGAPAPTYQWYLNGTALGGATSPVLTLSGLTNAQAGGYYVIVSNSAGHITSNTATLTIGSNPFVGTYFGNLGNGGTFALSVRADNTGVFLGYAPGSHTAYLDLNVVVFPGGGFTVTSVPSLAGGSIHTAAVGRAGSERLVVDGTIGADGTVSGAIGGVAFSASRAAAGATASVAGFYEAGASDGSAEAFAIVGPSGQCFLLVQTSGGDDGGAGTVTAVGLVSVTTAAGQTFSATISSATSLISATLTSATGSTTTFTGVRDGSAASARQRMINISSRADVSGGAQVAIAGFVIGGQQSKPVLIRAVGPALASFGVTGELAAPALTVYSGATVVASNTGWGSASSASEIAAAASLSGAFALPSGSADSAVVTTLAPGAYTAIVSSANGASGVALVEVYDLSGASPGQELINLSTRAFAGSGENALIAGVVVNGTAPKRLLIRAAGPALAQFGVSGVIASPQLTLYSGSTAIAQNAGWSGSADAAAIAQAAASVGAFTYAPGSTDAAIIINLPPGAYTAQVTGIGGTSGISLVEVYEVQ
jgi:YVTN family beta-propeller protein